MSLFKKFLSFFFICFFILFLTVLSVKVKAADESVDFTDQGYTNQQAISTYEGANFTISFDKGANSNAPKYYTSGTAIRAYGGNTFTISSENNITEIVITFGGSDGSNAITTDVGTYNNGTWTGNEKSVVFTIGGTSGNRRLSSITVTYEVSDTPADPVAVTGVSLNNSELNLFEGSNETLVHTVLPANATNKNVTWSSSDENVATVDQSGKVTGVAVGSATITVTTEDGSYTAQCNITVSEGPNPIVFSEMGLSDASNVPSLYGAGFRIDFNGNCKYYNNGSAVRAYGGSSFTISSENTISWIQLTYGSSDGSNKISVNNGNFNSPTWSGSSKSVTFTIDGSTGNRRIAEIEVKFGVIISFDANGGTGSQDDITVTKEEDSQELPAPSFIYSNHTFTGWNTKADGSGIAYKVGDVVENVLEDMTLYAQWEEANEQTIIQNSLNTINTWFSASYKLNYTLKIYGIDDLLTRETTGIEDGSTSYTSWSNVKSTSNAIYAGCSAGDKNSIQLRTKNSNEGLITTTSGGKAVCVTVEWNSDTSDGRKINVYGKNVAYEQPSDLYNNSKQGELLGSLTKGETELMIEGDYEYIGIRSSDSALYLNSIKITWGDVESQSVDSDSEFRLKLGVDKSLENIVEQLDAENRENADYGLVLQYGENTEKYISFKNSITGLYKENDKMYLLISLGNIFEGTNPKANAQTMFKIKPYFVSGSDIEYKYISDSNIKSYSYVSMIEAYYANNATKEAVKQLYDLMNLYGLIA